MFVDFLLSTFRARRRCGPDDHLVRAWDRWLRVLVLARFASRAGLHEDLFSLVIPVSCFVNLFEFWKLKTIRAEIAKAFARQFVCAHNTIAALPCCRRIYI